MKNIELTEEHKSKLLEMCKELFPEYKDYKWDVVHCTDDIKYNGILFMYKKDGNDDEFHWFEFCMTHLVRELMCKNTKHAQQLFMGLKHPIDYLYEQFLKLK